MHDLFLAVYHHLRNILHQIKSSEPQFIINYANCNLKSKKKFSLILFDIIVLLILNAENMIFCKH